MPIHPLPVWTEEQENKAISRLKPPDTIVVRYGYMGNVGEFKYSGTEIPGCGTRLVVRTPRGVELAEMLTTTCANGGCGHSISRKQMLDYIDASGGKQYPFTDDGRVLRIATPDDLLDQARLDGQKPEMIRAAKRLVVELKLDMKLVDLEILLGGERVIFYFASEGRIDFRELVRLLATELHTRIEMRQVGARDEARLVADYEKCGQQCCCKQFLKVLKPVSMRNAKIQKATLDPSKISGRCGRLMCCLRYEEATYDDLRKRLPHRNTRVKTDDGLGTVVNTQILTQLVLVELDESNQRAAYPLENIELINKAQEAEYLQQRQEQKDQLDQQRREQARNSRTERIERTERAERTDKAPRPARGGPDKRRPQPGKPLRDEEVQSKEGQAASEVNEELIPPAAGGGMQIDGPAEGEGEGPKKKRRRRRRRRRRGGGGEAGPNAQAGGAPDGGDSAGDSGGDSGGDSEGDCGGDSDD